MRYETGDERGTGTETYEVYDMEPVSGDYGPDYWASISDSVGRAVVCPVAGCSQRVVWHEAGYVPGYRVCLALSDDPDGDDYYDTESIRHRFQGRGTAEAPTLIRMPVGSGGAR